MKRQPRTRFTAALSDVIQEEDWRLPDGHVLRVYEEAIRRLETEIDEMKGERGNKRIDPLSR